MASSGAKVHQFFANEHNQVCYNGRHHHDYVLNYLARYVTAVEKTPKSKPLFSYTALNVAHDNVGLRVQTLDQHLMEFIDTMSQQENSVTFVLADHGNSYTRYQVQVLEGRLETYHPMMIGVIPHKVAQKLGEEVLENLRTNQHRLFNILDLRDGLVEVSKYDGNSKFKPTGLFGTISKTRTCNDLKMTKSSICICNGWDVPVKHSPTQLLIAEFAIGQLNNKIQNLLIKANLIHFLSGFCQRLRVKSIMNMRERKIEQGRKFISTMDIIVQSGNLLKQDEVFTVKIECATNSTKSYEMKLVGFKRISTYGVYEQCADSNVELQLCVCNKTNSSLLEKPQAKLDIVLNKTHPIYGIVGKLAEVIKLEPCLLLIQRPVYGIKIRKELVELKIFEIANICANKSFDIHVDADKGNSKSSVSSTDKLPKNISIPPQTLYFVTALKPEDARYNPKLNLITRVVRSRLTNTSTSTS